MDDRLIAQVNATATSLREAAKAADEELRAEQREREAIDARIEQLQRLKQQLEEAISQAEGTVSFGSASARKKTTRKRTASKAAQKRTATKAAQKRTAKKAARKKTTRKRASRGNGAGRQEAVLKVLADADGPVRPAQVAEQLRASGREDTSSQVSAALAQLARTDRAVKVGQGLYQKGNSG